LAITSDKVTIGNKGQNVVRGGAGNDKLNGGLSNDSLTAKALLIWA
jgi:Ca2+-binding RTX toxin-like protein